MPHTNGKSDLSAFFLRKCFFFTMKGGTINLIATKTISQGDTRACGLAPICIHEKGFIYSADRNRPWPGAAAVRYTSVHIQKGLIGATARLDGFDCTYISAFLRCAGPHSDPHGLASNSDMSFQGCNLSGQGFIFSDETEGSSPLSLMREIISRNPVSNRVIKPYISGSDINSLPDPSEVRRYAYGFGRDSLEECEALHPELVAVARRLVKYDREARPVNKQQQYLAERWWQWHTDRPSMQRAIQSKKTILVNSQATAYVLFQIASKEAVYAHTVNIFAIDTMLEFGYLQSLVHQAWAYLQGSSLGSTFRYTPTDCFETFPFPPRSAADITIDKAASDYHQTRSSLCSDRGIGLTAVMNLVSSPHTPHDSNVELLRSCIKQLSSAVLDAYGWNDIDGRCGFGLAQIEPGVSEGWSDEIIEAIEGANVFFATADEAIDFDSYLQGLPGDIPKLSWEYGWPSGIRDDVLARLLTLNAERYEEEVAMGLHSKGAKQASKTTSKRKTKSDSSAEFQLTSEIYQTGLKLF